MDVNAYSWLSASTRSWRTTELEQMGVSRRTITRLVERGILARLQVNAYVPAKYWKSLSNAEQGRFRVMAHNRARLALTQSAYSHTSAARIHRLTLWDVDDRIHITQPSSGSSREHNPDVVRHRAKLLPGEVDMVDGLQVTSLARTAVDSARLLSFRQGLITADHALHLGVQRAELHQVLQRQTGYKGVQIARQVVEKASALSESAGESLTAHLLAGMPIPPPEQQLVVRTRFGEHRIDFGWREQKLALEFDGKTKYFDYAPTPEVLFQERRREKALMEQGWIFIRLEWADLFQEATRGRILKAWWNSTRSAG
ncbi:hypothetical protein ASH00_06655 [Arthrobacter sp. Soil782]|uniref:type IV toxin-antitoxin system AbiEi family antitoxin domain-containing protein n=1 Tax=Arthrobacter sp. Soil782 TaxID=1736410 RepID=UPI0006F44128|nr:type IV toxin-antitoxin system AbiEi family antitoxin domain-containing protein [Arthrobacter sp. Soil782]KRF09302.1 hypothetical protein ASH00_06655 [Arthrobacter sp. Soil782]